MKSGPLCLVCQRLRPARSGRLTCMAFPNGIPAEMLDGRTDHRQPHPDDQGIRFEPDWSAPRAILARLGVSQVG